MLLLFYTEEREKKSEPKVDATLSNTIPPERRNNPGNPQRTPPVGYPPPQGHVPHHPLSHQAIPHSLRGPAPNQPPPIQSGHPAQFNHPPRPPSNQPGMSQYIPRVPSATLLTARPRMSYPHPPFPATSQEGLRLPTSVSWQPPLRPGDTSPTATGNIRFPPSQGIRPPNVPQGPSLPPQQLPGRPQLAMHNPQGQVFQHGQVGSGRGNWQPQQHGKGSYMIPQRPMVPQQPVISQQPRAAGQQPSQQRPPSQVLPAVQQHQLPPQQLPQTLPQQPARPETPPSPQKIQQPYQSNPPSYQQQFGIGSSQQLKGPGPQHLQQVPQQQPGPYQNPSGQPPHAGQRPGQYQQQPGQQSIPNQPSRSRQIPTAYQHQPPIRMPPLSIQQPIHQPLQHALPPGSNQVPPQQQPQSTRPPHHQPPPQHLPPQQQHPGAPPQQPAGQYHQLSPYHQRFPYQPQQQSGVSHHQIVSQHTHQQGFQGPARTGPLPHQQRPNQQPGQHIPPVQNPPPTPYHQLPSSQVPHNLPPALAPQSYQKQPLIQKISSENLPQKQRGPYHPAQNPPPESCSQPLMQEKVPYQTNQQERPVNPPAQLPYSSPALPSQTQNTDKMHPNPSQDKLSQFQQPYYNQTSESQYPPVPTSQQQPARQTGGQSSSGYINQQWQQQQYRPTSPHQHTTTPHPQTNKTVQDPNISKPGVYSSASAYPVPSSTHNVSQTPQENRPSDPPPNISKPAVYPSSNPSSQIGSSVSSTYTHPTSSHNFPQISQENRPSQQVDPFYISKPGVYPSPSSQGIPTQHPHSTSNENVTQTQHDPPPNTHNPNPSHDTMSQYFPAVCSQASQPYSTENQPTDNVTKGSGLSTDPNFRSRSIQEFSPTKVVLSKPGALSVSPLPGSPSATTTKQDLRAVLHLVHSLGSNMT